MKVLHLLDTLAMGGKESFTVGLAGAQKAAGMDADIATFDPGNAFAGEIETRGLRWHRFSRRGALDWSLVGSLRNLVASQGYAMVHCHAENPAMYGALAVAFRRTPMLVTVHSGDRDAIRLAIKVQNRLAYSRANLIVAVSDAIRARLIKSEFAPAKKTETIDNGIVPPAAPDEVQAARLRTELRLPPQAVTVLCVGRLVPVKNHSLFLEAFSAARAAIPELAFILAGDGPLNGELAAKASALGLQDSIRMLGARKDVGHLLTVCDIFALPSLNEGHSISLLEACSFGKAIIASDRGGNPSIIRGESSGLLVDPESVPDMAAALICLARDPALRAAYGAKAKSQFASKYAMDRCLRDYARAYARFAPAFGRWG
jgi:glycosyltransferase involved in cell wall biosynthesis